MRQHILRGKTKIIVSILSKSFLIIANSIIIILLQF